MHTFSYEYFRPGKGHIKIRFSFFFCYQISKINKRQIFFLSFSLREIPYNLLRKENTRTAKKNNEKKKSKSQYFFFHFQISPRRTSNTINRKATGTANKVRGGPVQVEQWYSVIHEGMVLICSLGGMAINLLPHKTTCRQRSRHTRISTVECMSSLLLNG